ncbi:hypothetical protein TruAng_008183 [Truncatella angustata]|nr:hypothetical protein TruAng_008183 [Truncatella angustata]
MKPQLPQSMAIVIRNMNFGMRWAIVSHQSCSAVQISLIKINTWTGVAYTAKRKCMVPDGPEASATPTAVAFREEAPPDEDGGRV